LILSLVQIAVHHEQQLQARVAALEAQLQGTASKLHSTRVSRDALVAAKTEKKHPAKMKSRSLVGARLRVEGWVRCVSICVCFKIFALILFSCFCEGEGGYNFLFLTLYERPAID
jgi:hypothetical protein